MERSHRKIAFFEILCMMPFLVCLMSSSALHSIFKENRRTLALAAPIVAGHVGQMLMGWADTIMIGRLGVVPLAACAFANTLLMVPFVFGFGVVSSVSVRGALGFGAGDRRASGEAYRAGLLVGGGVGLVVSISLVLFLPLLGIFGQKPEVNAAAGTYFLLLGASVIPALIATASKNFCEALSRPWIPFWILMASVCLNVILNWVLIYGNLGVPALGLEGAGWATLASRGLGGLAMIVYPLVSPRLGSYTRGLWRVGDLAREARALVALGLPVGAMHLAEVSGFALGSLMMGWISIQALAAHQIAITCAATTFMIPLGLSQAVSVRVGQARGRGVVAELKPIVWGGLGLALVLMTGCALVLIFGGTWIARLFTTDANLIPLAVQLLMVAGFFQVFDGLQIVSSGTLRGFEDVRFPMGIGIGAYWCVGLPVSYALAFLGDVGALGVWLGLCLGLAVAAVALIWRVLYRLRRESCSAGAR